MRAIFAGDDTVGTKIFEIFAMLFAVFAFRRGSHTMAFAVIFLASTQAAFFSPAKYGLLPELLPDELLSWGNGILELTLPKKKTRNPGALKAD